MKPEARVFEIASLKKQCKVMQCCIFPIFFKVPCMCDLLHSVGIHCICELLFLRTLRREISTEVYQT